MGIVYEMYRPMVAILVAAANATAEPSEGSASRNARKAASQIARTGTSSRVLTLANQGEIPPSRANAYITA